MASQPRRDDAQLAADEEQVLKLELELEETAQKLLDYRTTLPGKLSSTISSLLQSQRPVLPVPDADAGVNQDIDGDVKFNNSAAVIQFLASCLMRESTGLPVVADSDEAEKLQLLKQKISSNATAMPVVVLSRLKEYMARIDALDSSNGIIHPAFEMKRTS
ncbi:hypothetical protein SASPL_153515 [Salvia splendens]|uniref:Uncharacterized protein n=1 Tax=Salvia splendens TaxID=180675 RepID=A0A8X8W550_SALSN|nr:hypothetical protein SASPL_153515 [Salvia splendens]